MIHRISLVTNVVLSLIFIGIVLITTFNNKFANPASIYVLLFILFGFGIFLCFDFICYRFLKLNREKVALSDRMKNYGKIIFVTGILGLICILFMTVAATYAFLSSNDSLPERQRPFYVAFLILLLISAVTHILNSVGYFKSLKENKNMLIESINDIGSLQ